MKSPTLYDKVLELYLRSEKPSLQNIKRVIRYYTNKNYSEKKLEKLVNSLLEKHEFEKDANRVKCRTQLSSYIDSIIAKRLRESYKLSKTIDLNSLDERMFKSLVKQIVIYFGYKILLLPDNDSNLIDAIVHRGDTKICILSIKCAPQGSVGEGAVKQLRYVADHYNCEQALLVSSSSFDDEAITVAFSSGVTLIDRDKLIPMVQDIIDNRGKEEDKLLVSGLTDKKENIYLEGRVKLPKSKVQVLFIKYSADEMGEVTFEGELSNTGKRPIINLSAEISIIDRDGNCAFHQKTPIIADRMESKEKIAFSILFSEVMKSDWPNLCKYELKLEYENIIR